MDRFRERDTRFPGSQQDWKSTQGTEVARQPPVHFHSPAYVIYETKKHLALLKPQILGLLACIREEKRRAVFLHTV
jgi:hypothetical protein